MLETQVLMQKLFTMLREQLKTVQIHKTLRTRKRLAIIDKLVSYIFNYLNCIMCKIRKYRVISSSLFAMLANKEN